ncbi:MAG: MBL fold metallo-hydrolase [Planctomycetes bacterium]|nr:MBL fold metallo-hydrolase [Planctomycetota bacterium]
MIEAKLKDDALLADIVAARSEADTLHVWWLGQSGFLLQYNGRHLLLDPYLSDSLTRKYAETDKPHVRMTELAIDPARLDFIDVLTSSHNHTDHLDGETLTSIMQANPSVEIIVPEANRQFVADRLSVLPDRLRILDAGQNLEAAGFQLHALPAAHEEVERDEAGRCKFLGYVVQCGPWRVYHSGDTVLYDGMADLLREFSIDLALLPINGSLPERRVAGNLWGREAARLAKEIGAKLVIPCHFDMFEFNTESPEEFVATCDQIGQPYQVLACGERWSG